MFSHFLPPPHPPTPTPPPPPPSTPTTPRPPPTTLIPDSAEVSKGALSDVHRSCALLCTELLKRCTHRDMTAEYRGVATSLQEEISAALLCADWPVSGVLHGHWVRRLTAELAANISVEGDRDRDRDREREGGAGGAGGKGRKDPSFVTFLMDQLGAVAGGIRRVILDAERVCV